MPSAKALLPREHRLVRRRDFRTVQSRGRKYVGPNVIVRALGKDAGPTRVGFSVSEKVGKSVVRNRVRRRLRESVRVALGEASQLWDVVVIARPQAAESGFDALKRDVARGIAAACR